MAQQNTQLDLDNEEFDENIATQQEIDELNASLGLVVPENALTESIPIWKSFFFTLRSMMASDTLEESDLPALVEAFATVPDSEKQERLNTLSQEHSRHLESVEFKRDLWFVEEQRQAFDDYIDLLPEEVRDKIKYYFATGEEIDIDKLNEEIAQLEAKLSVDQQARLNDILYSRSRSGLRVDQGDEKSSYAVRKGTGSVLNADQLEERFNSSAGSNSNNGIQLPEIDESQLQEIESQPAEVEEVILPPQRNPQPLPSQPNIQSSPQPTRSPQPPRKSLDQLRSKPSGTLDDLLNK